MASAPNPAKKPLTKIAQSWNKCFSSALQAVLLQTKKSWSARNSVEASKDRICTSKLRPNHPRTIHRSHCYASAKARNRPTLPHRPHRQLSVKMVEAIMDQVSFNSHLSLCHFRTNASAVALNASNCTANASQKVNIADPNAAAQTASIKWAKKPPSKLPSQILPKEIQKHLWRNWRWMRTNCSIGRAVRANAQGAVKAIVNAFSLACHVLRHVSASLVIIVLRHLVSYQLRKNC